MIENLKDFITKMNSKGIPTPMLRDPVSGLPSVTLTMLFISFLVVLVGLIGKFSKGLDIDLTQAIYWNAMLSALYLGRKFQGNGATKSVNTDGDNK